MLRLNLKNFSFVQILNPKYVCDFNFRKVFAFFSFIYIYIYIYIFFFFYKIPCGSPRGNLRGIKIIF